VDVDAIPGNRVVNLLGRVLCDGVAHLIRRGLDRGYVGFDEEARRLRGKMMLFETIQCTLLPQGRIACHVDEHSHNVPHNRLINAAMAELIVLPGLDNGLRSALRNHLRRMYTVSDVELSSAVFRSIQLHRNVPRYAFLVNVCHLLPGPFFPTKA